MNTTTDPGQNILNARFLQQRAGGRGRRAARSTSRCAIPAMRGATDPAFAARQAAYMNELDDHIDEHADHLRHRRRRARLSAGARGEQGDDRRQHDLVGNLLGAGSDQPTLGKLAQHKMQVVLDGPRADVDDDRQQPAGLREDMRMNSLSSVARAPGRRPLLAAAVLRCTSVPRDPPWLSPTQFFDPGPQAALEIAIRADDREALPRALAGGAAVNAAGKFNITPLMIAVDSQDLAAVHALLKAGALAERAWPRMATARSAWRRGATWPSRSAATSCVAILQGRRRPERAPAGRRSRPDAVHPTTAMSPT